LGGGENEKKKKHTGKNTKENMEQFLELKDHNIFHVRPKGVNSKDFEWKPLKEPWEEKEEAIG